MKTTSTIILLTLSLVSIAQDKQTAQNCFSILTNDSVRYWENYSSFHERYKSGLSFSADSTWTEYSIDAQGNRVRVLLRRSIDVYGEEFKFSINNDTLYLKYLVDSLWLVHEMYKFKIIDTHCICLTRIEFTYAYDANGIIAEPIITRDRKSVV